MTPAILFRAVSHSLAFVAAAGIVAFSITARPDWKGKHQDRHKAAALREVTLVRWSLPKDARASAVTFTINNQSYFDIRDLTVTCTQVTKAGSVIAETKTIPHAIKANSSRTIAVPSSSLRLSSGALLSCTIDDFKTESPQRLAVVAERMANRGVPRLDDSSPSTPKIAEDLDRPR
jgi:hypothetical protein